MRHVLTTDTVSLSDPLDPAVLRRAAGLLTVTVDDASRARLAQGHRVFRTLRDGDGTGPQRPIYGATTGFGALVGYAGRADEADQCDNTLAHLGAGQGPDLPPGVVRAALLIRARSLAQGVSGVRADVVERLAEMFATTFTPAVPRYGSVGASGDLIPLAYATQALRGRGHAYADGRRMPAAEALAATGLRPLALDGRDALALVNGTSVTTAALALAHDAVRTAHRSLTALTCLLADLLGCDTGFLDADLMRAYAHPGAGGTAARMRQWLEGTEPSGTRPLQEPYSIRCSPQLLGAAEDALRYVDTVVAADLAQISDNPLFFPGTAGEEGGARRQLLRAARGVRRRPARLCHRPARQPRRTPARPAGRPAPQRWPAAPARHPARRPARPAGRAAGDHRLRRRDPPQRDPRRHAEPADQPAQPGRRPLRHPGRPARPRHGRAARPAVRVLALGLRQAVHVGARRPTAPRCADLLDALSAAIDPVDPDRPLDADVRTAARLLADRALP